jgi:hypothetical protein
MNIPILGKKTMLRKAKLARAHPAISRSISWSFRSLADIFVIPFLIAPRDEMIIAIPLRQNSNAGVMIRSGSPIKKYVKSTNDDKRLNETRSNRT